MDYGCGKGHRKGACEALCWGWLDRRGECTDYSRSSTLASELPAGAIHAFPLDITDEAEVTATVRTIEAELGPLDLAILNAGTHVPTDADNFTTEDVRFLVDTNFIGTVNGIAAVLEVFKRRSCGHLAVVASLAGYRGLPGAAAYGATKAALINLCEALAPDLERSGIKLNLINPGFGNAAYGEERLPDAVLDEGGGCRNQYRPRFGEVRL